MAEAKGSIEWKGGREQRRELRAYCMGLLTNFRRLDLKSQTLGI